MSKTSDPRSELSRVSRRAWLQAAAPAALALPAVFTCSSLLGEDSEAPEIAKPESVTLKTKDGVRLVATYYASNVGKEAVPIVLLHMFKHNRNELAPLALKLQKQGYAVLAPDLRGHGESTEMEGGGSISATTLTLPQFQSMVALDMEAVKKFLWKANNKEELNLNKLVLVGGEMGASVAINYALLDWSIPDYGPLQMGHFVKGLVLLSPEWSFKGLDMKAVPGHVGVRSAIAVMILVGGETSKATGEANRIYDIFKKYHEEPKGEDDAAKRTAKKTLFLGKMKTGLQGTKMLEAKELNVDKHISTFIKLRMIDSDAAKDTPWKELKLPHQ